MNPPTPPASRRTWPLRDRPGLVWLGLAAALTLVHRWVPGSGWLLVHLVLLGALTHSAMVWSTHFTQALLKTPAEIDDRTQQNRRIATAHRGGRRGAGRGADRRLAAHRGGRDGGVGRGAVARHPAVAPAAARAAGAVPGHRSLLPRRGRVRPGRRDPRRLAGARPGRRAARAGARRALDGDGARLGRAHRHRHAGHPVADDVAHPDGRPRRTPCPAGPSGAGRRASRCSRPGRPWALAPRPWPGWSGTSPGWPGGGAPWSGPRGRPRRRSSRPGRSPPPSGGGSSPSSSSDGDWRPARRGPRWPTATGPSPRWSWSASPRSCSSARCPT